LLGAVRVRRARWRYCPVRRLSSPFYSPEPSSRLSGHRLRCKTFYQNLGSDLPEWRISSC
jgi:hypothetical protein